MTIKNRLLLALAGLCALAACASAQARSLALSSPDGHLRIELQLDEAQGRLSYRVQRDGRAVLLDSPLGLQLEGADLSRDLRWVAASAPRRIDEHYELWAGKRRFNHHRAREQVLTLANPAGQRLELSLRAANDGVALRYRALLGGTAPAPRFVAELTGFRFAPDARAWLQPMSVAKSGWMRSNPAYEEHYQREIAVGTPAPTPAGWVLPALFRSGTKGEDWVAISEAGMDGRFHASRLQTDGADGLYRLGPPPPEEVFTGRALLAEGARGELLTPWRLLAVGSLGTLVESTLGTDLAAPRAVPAGAWLKPGLASWSWALLKDDFTTYEVQKKFIDYAAAMGWDYTLVDADWDRKIGYERLGELAAYAKSRGVGLLAWYNSAGDWNDVEYTPKSRLLTPDSRRQEFARLRALGIRGVKIDFFGGDGASMQAYYLALLQDAAAAGLLVNFHGATLPRGWARTYPNLMTAEAVRGLEFTTFTQEDQDRVARHAAMLPFTRNLFDPMDFTPLVFGDIPNIERRTRNGFELAEAVLFLSGIQHFAEVPEGMATVPGYVRQYLKTLPRRWDEVRFVAGHPGKYVVIARRAGKTWHLAGINAEDEPLPLRLDLSFMGPARAGRLIGEGQGEREFVQRPLAAARTLELQLQPHGGFVAVFPQMR